MSHTLQPTPGFELPLLNLRDFAEGSAADRQRFVAQLRAASHDPGFFLLSGWALDDAEGELAQAERILHWSRRFFALPAADKQAVAMVHSPQYRGYTVAGAEITRGERDWREQFDTGAERPLWPAGPDTPGAPDWARLQGPNQWPAALPGLRPVVLAWQDLLTRAATVLLRALALALGQPEDAFARAFAGTPVQHLKLVRYPGRAEGQSDQGVGPHKDAGCLTLLLQGPGAGLQVQPPGRSDWIAVPPRDGTLVINLGEVLEIVSNGYLRATLHRVVSPELTRERHSVAFFLSPRLDAVLPPLVLPPELAAAARGVEQDPRNPLIAHTGQNLLKGRLRSHPDVTARHHADLVAQPLSAAESDT